MWMNWSPSCLRNSLTRCLQRKVNLRRNRQRRQQRSVCRRRNERRRLWANRWRAKSSAFTPKNPEAVARRRIRLHQQTAVGRTSSLLSPSRRSQYVPLRAERFHWNPTNPSGWRPSTQIQTSRLSKTTTTASCLRWSIISSLSSTCFKHPNYFILLQCLFFCCIVVHLPCSGWKDCRLFSAWAEDQDSTEAPFCQAGGQSKSVDQNFKTFTQRQKYGRHY